MPIKATSLIIDSILKRTNHIFRKEFNTPKKAQILQSNGKKKF